MRFVRIKSAAAGMILATDVLDGMGRILISKGTALTAVYIEKLHNLEIVGVYIDDELSKGIEIEETISPKLRTEGINAVRNKDIDSCKKVAKLIVEELLEKGKVSMDMTDLKTFDNYTFAHSVSVAVFSCTIGLGLRLPEKDLENIVLAGLLHDMGKVDIPDEILNKPGRLTPEEFAIIKAHPMMSYDLIKDRMDISSLVKNAVMTHHENYDGTGYPNCIAGSDLTQIARILHVADVYDALVSKRPYKEPYSPYAAIEILKGGSGTLYDPAAVDAFIKYVPLYPKGSMVEINGEMMGIVVENYGPHNLRPIVRLEDMVEMDLSDYRNSDYVITNPADTDYFAVLKEEQDRKNMVKPIERHTVMIIDSMEETYNNISRKMSQLYDFVRVPTDSMAEGIIKKNGTPDIVLIDVDHRDLSDFEYLKEKIRRLSNVVPVVVLGSYRDVDTIQLFKRIGVRNYVLKPYRIIYLQSEISRHIREQR